MMERMRFETEDFSGKNIEKIGQLFPNCITEKKDSNGKIQKAINFKMLKQMLSEDVVADGEEAYEFTWVGKKEAMVEANKPIRKTLRPCKEESKDWDTTENLYIEGDNLEVLKLLQESYLNSIKMIYIDPPYNTGSDFIYNDDFKMTNAEYEDVSGEVDAEGNRLFKNTDANGRFHSDWCSMMYSRLLLARNLLKEDGAIFISIDEIETNAMRFMCDEIFGASNFIAQLVWAGGRKNDSKHISISHEFVLCYFKNINYITEQKIIWRERKEGLDDIYKEYEKLKNEYKNPSLIEKALKQWYRDLPNNHPAKNHSHYSCVDEKGIYFADNISWPGGGGPKYKILHPITQKPVKVPSRGWITNKPTLEKWIAEGKVKFGETENNVPTLKAYLKDRENAVPYSVFYQDGRAASKRLARLMGCKVFENPKDEDVIKRFIEFATLEGDVVLDFFSGSGTTAHSVLLANVEQNIHRKFIMVQLPEKISAEGKNGSSKKVAKNAIEFLEGKGFLPNICEIGKERIRLAGDKIKVENADKPGIDTLDTGFRVLKVDDTNMKDVYYVPEEYDQTKLFDLESNIKEDRTDLDLLYGCLIDWGLPLNRAYKSTDIDGNKVHIYNEGDLVACFAEGISESTVKAIAKMKPLRVVFRDAGFQTSASKINIEEMFKLLSPETSIRVL